jgi:hypothetical protein
MSLVAVSRLLAAHAARPLDPHEAAMTAAIRDFIAAQPECLWRSCVPGHLTGSAWVVSPDRRRVLLTHHRKLDKWLQLGGHADGDPDLAAVAQREAHEESGLMGIRLLSPEVFDVDRHWIPERKGELGTTITTCVFSSRPTRPNRWFAPASRRISRGLSSSA